METILVGIDGSPDSLAALRWAAWLAAATERRLVLAYAWQHDHRPVGVFSTPHLEPSALEADLVETLRRLAAEEVADAALVADCCTPQGLTATALETEATRRGAALIVVGASGVGGARRAFLGSVSRALTECPTHAVAVVPTHEVPADTADRPFLVGADGSDGSARAVRWAAESARRAGGEVVAVHAFESPVPDASPAEVESLAAERRLRLEEEWCGPLAARGVRHRAVLDRGGAGAVLRRVARDERPACGVLGSRGLGAFTGRLLGSVTHRLVRELEWPVVVVPSARDRIVWPP